MTDDDEPFSGSVTFGCVPPGKRYRPVENLSAGEKTMAAVALLFAMQSYDSEFLYTLSVVHSVSVSETAFMKIYEQMTEMKFCVMVDFCFILQITI